MLASVIRQRSEDVCLYMTTIDIRAMGPTARVRRAAREWWPVPALIGLAVLAQQVLLAPRYDVGGHAAGHLGGASIPFMAAAVLAILVWATPLALRQVDVLVCVAAWFGATIVVMVGNLRVVDDLVAAGYSHTPTDSVPDVADHSLANSSVWYGVAAALVLVASLRLRRHIGNRTTIGAALATVVFPPWVIPGAGVVVLAIVRCVARHREHAVADIAPGRQVAARRRVEGEEPSAGTSPSPLRRPTS
jgi:hypothetical protein